MRVAVIGGGYAGMAAAVTLADSGVPVTVFESAKILGGRARRVEHRETVLDNGLHVLIGAYGETLSMMRRVGADPTRHLLRLPFAWSVSGRLALEAARLPAPLHMAVALIRARGLSLADRFRALRLLRAIRRAEYRLQRDVSVAQLLEAHEQGPVLSRLLWRPLCVSALNTAPERASAQVFLNVMRDSLAAGRHASDLLLPRVDLTRMFPEPAAAWIAKRGGNVATGQRVTAVSPAANGYTVRASAGASDFSHVVCAVAPQQLGAMLTGLPALTNTVELVARFSYQPIYSVYLQYPEEIRLATPMLGFDGTLLQWAFDRGHLAGQRGLIGAVISAEGIHQSLAHETLGRLAHQELEQQLAGLPAPLWVQVIAEKRATFACVPSLERPGNRTALPGFFLAGDYTASDYPATIESAVRSGVGAARLVLRDQSGLGVT